MMRSLYSGVSGLRTHQTKMDVIGNNIANVNTVAFKSSSVTFSDIMYQTTSGASGATQNTGGVNAKQIGLGVVTGATKVAITSAGASESTGNAFDIKLTDGNSTNFFVVNNGSETLFTRAGSFYLDGNGNLAMASTGFLVQGWQVDPTNGTIRRDTVSPLRIMQPANLTSSPEWTKNASVSGVIDKNDTNITSDSGYYMTLQFYDNLGYSYTAKFAIKTTDAEAKKGNYTVELNDIYNTDGHSILEDYIKEYIVQNPTTPDDPSDPASTTHTTNRQDAIATLFGKVTTGTKEFDVDSDEWTIEGDELVSTADKTIKYKLSDLTIGADGSISAGALSAITTLPKLYGVATDIDEFMGHYGLTAADVGTALSIGSDGKLNVKYPTTNYDLHYSTADGSFGFVNEKGVDSVSMNLTAIAKLGKNNPDFTYAEAFADIDVDFTKTLNYDNGGTSTAGIEKGAVDGTTGYGKALGVLTGVSVSSNGEIYGSYDNGNTVLLGQIAVAQFTNASGLESVGNNCYAETLNSGEFDGIGVDVTGDGGSMNTGQLEMSNVDLSQEFTSMITTQRGFQANSRIITVSDTMLEELTNLKR